MSKFSHNNKEAIRYLCEEFKKYNQISPEDSKMHDVKRGLRNADGTGVLAGLTQICDVLGYEMIDGVRTPVDGELIYRGINVKDLIKNNKLENRFGYEEMTWLLLFGKLPTSDQIDALKEIIGDNRALPDGFAEDMIMKSPSPNIMNKMSSAMLALYCYDKNPDGTELENLMRQSIDLVAKMPTIMVNAYQVKRWVYDKRSMYFHHSKSEFSVAENILRTMRPDKQFTDKEAKLLDLMMILHAEHGGGNNSSFACRVLSSSGTDTYSAISAAIGSLKGPRHGGANIKVMEMLDYIKMGVKNWEDEDEIANFLRKIIAKEEGDGSGLIYGMGHAVYTKSDPRTLVLKASAEEVLKGTSLEREFNLLKLIEKLTPEVFAEVKGSSKDICANVDMYSGIIYKHLQIPTELFTPFFAISRVPGWCAHRIEEITTGGRIMRPAYKCLMPQTEYIPLSERSR